MADTQTWTVGKLLEWTTQFLGQHGSDSPRLDAEVLLAHARQCQRIQLYTSFNEEPTEEVRAAFRELVRRRKEGEPVAYLVGHKEFYSLNILVSPAVLIPRSETEYAVVEVLDRAKGLAPESSLPESSLLVADVCCGSGCIAIAVAKHLPQARLIAIDLSPDALEMAAKNIALHNLEGRIELLHSDLLTGLATQEECDIIVSNPPYVSQSEYEQLAPGVRHYEPKQALLADDDGFAMIERLGRETPKYLKLGGFLIVEISPMLANRVEHWFTQHACWKLERIIKDLAGHPRIAVAKLQSKE